MRTSYLRQTATATPTPRVTPTSRPRPSPAFARHREAGQNRRCKDSVKNYMSDKIGAADSGIITIDQPAGLASENII